MSRVKHPLLISFTTSMRYNIVYLTTKISTCKKPFEILIFSCESFFTVVLTDGRVEEGSAASRGGG